LPEYRTDASGLMVQFRTDVRPNGKVTEKTPQKTPQKTLQKTPDRIVALLRTNGSLSIKELAGQIGKSPSAVQRALNKLQGQRIIERIGPDKGGHWIVKERP